MMMLYGALLTGGGHPLSCSIWKDAVCDCPQERPAGRANVPDSCGSAGHSYAQVDHNLDHDFSEPSDTERPSASVDGRSCYFCGEPATELVHVDMPVCDSCKRRAVGRRSK